ncbi:MAG: hypothetical protein MSS96_01070 [Bacteroidales bacterium]|nr:hypothetical protein [Bacteroidales bacterium]
MVELKRKVTLKTKSAASEEDAAEKVHLKKKVTIKEKHAEEELPTSGNDGGNEGNPTPTPDYPKGRKWILWLIIIVALAIIGYLWHSHSGSSEQGDGNLGDSTKVENTDSTKSQSSDSIATADSSKAEASVGSGGKISTEAESATSPKGYGNAETRESAIAPQKQQEPNKLSSDVSGDSKPKLETNVPLGTVEETANEVIRGLYGNGNVRKNKLGSRYHEIQDRVNEMYRQGLVN